MITEGIICTRCGKLIELINTEDIGDEEYGLEYTFKCNHCGAIYECTEVAEKYKKDYPFYENEEENIWQRQIEPDIMNGHCINCGGNVSVSNNFMLSDYDETITDEKDDKMNFVLNQCPNCGMQEVRWDTSETEKKDYPYWHNER